MKLFLFTLFLSSSSLISFSQSTTLDVTFGTNGIVTTSIGAATSVIHSMVIQTDGKIVAAGTGSDGVTSEFAIARYKTDGTLDSTFDGDGKLTTGFGSQAEAFSVAIQNDGKIVAGGYMYNDSTWEFAIARYNTDGSIDSIFGGTGKIHMAIGSVDDEINAVCIQSDGKIVAVGYSNTAPDINTYTPAIAVVRYNSDGTLDGTFNGTGKVTTSLGLYDIGYSVEIQVNGKIVVGGTHVIGSNYEFLVVRYNIDGSLDNSFNSNGTAITAIGNVYDVVHSVAIQNDGKIVASGTSAVGTNYDNYVFALARYNSDGSIDSTFDSDGKVTISLGSYFDIAPSIAIQTDGKILVAGGVSNNGVSHDIGIVRYNDTGSIDTTFDGDGKVITSLNSNSTVYTLKLSGTRLYVAGAENQFLVAAYQEVFTLPVHLLSFTGFLQNNTTKLQWEASDLNVAKFSVERSNDGRNFINLGEVNSLINGSQNNYGFTDIRPLKGTNFYRLKMIENGGNFIYSKVIAVKMNANSLMKLFPNPATDLIQLQIPSLQKEKIILQITDAAGNIISRQVIVSPGTPISTSIDITELQKGVYFLSVNTSGKVQVNKFIKQ